MTVSLASPGQERAGAAAGKRRLDPDTKLIALFLLREEDTMLTLKR